MILKGNQRGGAKQLALHLLNSRENDHIEIHAIDGLIADDLTGALKEMHAISRATNCKQFMFSLSLSPPKEAIVTVQDFEDAIDQAAEKLGLAGQPRVVLFHEKNARRHCHVIISRINIEEMKGINLPFYKTRLVQLSRELYLSHGWDLPKGLSDKSFANPANFGLIEWQEARRAKRDPREIKSAVKQCWTQSDGAPAFEAALEDKGFWLCSGDRRGFVIVDWTGNVYSLSRWLGVKPRELKERLGAPGRYQTVKIAQMAIATMLTQKHKALATQIDAEFDRRMELLEAHRQRLRDQNRRERQKLRSAQRERQDFEAIERSCRLRKGLRGIWDWATGRRREILARNRAELKAAKDRDRLEAMALIVKQRQVYRSLQGKIDRLTTWHEQELGHLYSPSTAAIQPSSGLHPDTVRRWGGDRHNSLER